MEREFFTDNLLVRIHFIIVMIRWTGLAPWECEFLFPGSLTSTFLGKSGSPDYIFVMALDNVSVHRYLADRALGTVYTPRAHVMLHKRVARPIPGTVWDVSKARMPRPQFKNNYFAEM